MIAGRWIALCALPISLLVSMSNARADFFEEYAGTSYQYALTGCFNGKCQTTPFYQAEVRPNGVYFAGQGVLFKGRINRYDANTKVELHSHGSNGYEMTSYVTQGGKTYEMRYIFKFQGSGCVVTYQSNTSSTGSVNCVLLGQKGKTTPAKDNSEACKAVTEVKAKIEALLGKERNESCDTSMKVEKLSTSIRGANCASKMAEIDRVLRKHDSNVCRKEYNRKHGPTGDGGVRG